MPRRIRKQIYIDPEQERALKKLAKRTGRTEADIVRAAVDAYVHDPAGHHARLQALRNILEHSEQHVREAGNVAEHVTWTREELHERGTRK